MRRHQTRDTETYELPNLKGPQEIIEFGEEAVDEATIGPTTGQAILYGRDGLRRIRLV